MKNASHMLINEHPMMVLPTLAKAIGLHESIVLQQVHFLLQGKNSGREINGRKWIWKTLDEWNDECLKFWTTRSIKKIIRRLEKAGHLLSCQPDGRMSRKKYYSVNYDSVNAALDRERELCSRSKGKKVPRPHSARSSPSLTETTPEISYTETSRKEGKSPSKKDVCVFVPPSAQEVQDYMNLNQLNVEAVRSWYFGNRDNGWKIDRRRRIHDWRKALTAYVQNYKLRPHDPLSDKDLQAFAEENDIPSELYDKWLEWGNRKHWQRRNPRTGADEPIFDLKASLLAFKDMVDNQY